MEPTQHKSQLAASQQIMDYIVYLREREDLDNQSLIDRLIGQGADPQLANEIVLAASAPCGQGKQGEGPTLHHRGGDCLRGGLRHLVDP